MTMKADEWRRTATVYMLTAALMVLLTVATWPRPAAVVEAFTAGIAVGAAIMTFCTFADAPGLRRHVACLRNYGPKLCGAGGSIARSTSAALCFR
jgi:hypothetical protein